MLEQKEEEDLRYNMEQYLIISFTEILKHMSSNLRYILCDKIPKLTKAFEHHIYKTTDPLK